MAGIDDVNRHPVIHTWSYKLADDADIDSNQTLNLRKRIPVILKHSLHA